MVWNLLAIIAIVIWVKKNPAQQLFNSPTKVGLFYNYDGHYIPDKDRGLNLKYKISFFCKEYNKIHVKMQP